MSQARHMQEVWPISIACCASLLGLWVCSHPCKMRFVWATVLILRHGMPVADRPRGADTLLVTYQPAIAESRLTVDLDIYGMSARPSLASEPMAVSHSATHGYFDLVSCSFYHLPMGYDPAAADTCAVWFVDQTSYRGMSTGAMYFIVELPALAMTRAVAMWTALGYPSVPSSMRVSVDCTPGIECRGGAVPVRRFGNGGRLEASANCSFMSEWLGEALHISSGATRMLEEKRETKGSRLVF